MLESINDCDLSEGQIIRIQGFELIVSNIRKKGKDHFGEMVYTFTGICTTNPVNDTIRDTAYNGGQYSWRNSDALP